MAIRIPSSMPEKGWRHPNFWGISSVKGIISLCLIAQISYSTGANPENLLDGPGLALDSLVNMFCLTGFVKGKAGDGLENVTVLLLQVEELDVAF